MLSFESYKIYVFMAVGALMSVGFYVASPRLLARDGPPNRRVPTRQLIVTSFNVCYFVVANLATLWGIPLPLPFQRFLDRNNHTDFVNQSVQESTSTPPSESPTAVASHPILAFHGATNPRSSLSNKLSCILLSLRTRWGGNIQQRELILPLSFNPGSRIPAVQGYNVPRNPFNSAENVRISEDATSNFELPIKIQRPQAARTVSCSEKVTACQCGRA